MNIKERYDHILRIAASGEAPENYKYRALHTLRDECNLAGHVYESGKCVNCGHQEGEL